MSKKDKSNFNIPTGNQSQQKYASEQDWNSSRAYYNANNPDPSPRQTSNAAVSQTQNNSSLNQAQDGFTYNNYQEDVPQSIFSQQQTQSAGDNFAPVDETRTAAHSASGNVTYKPKQRRSPIKSILSFVLVLVIFVGAAFALRTYVFCAYEIPSGSMENTIMTGDMVFAEKVSKYFASPKRGDIITFDDPNKEERVLIKRVIAVGGQTVDIKNNKVYVDNVELDEPYTNGRPTKKLSSSITYPYTVPQGHVWVMGDNRTNSSDSRSYGSVPQSTIIGKALAVYWPTSSMKLLN